VIFAHFALESEDRAMAKAQDDDDLLPDDEAAEFLGLAPATLRQWRYQKRGPAYYKVGRFAYYRVRDLKGWREKQRREPKAA
jgi:Helix-turn-helix domain